MRMSIGMAQIMAEGLEGDLEGLCDPSNYEMRMPLLGPYFASLHVRIRDLEARVKELEDARASD